MFYPTPQMPIFFYQLRWTIVITLAALVSPLTSVGQHTAALKVHMFWTINGLYTVGFEQVLSRHVSADLTVQAGHYIDVRPNRWEDYEVSGMGVVGALRYFPFTKAIAPRGFFGYTGLRYVDFNEAFLYTASGEHYEVGGNIVNIGLGIGYKFVYRRVGLEAFVGWGAGRLKSNDEEYRNNIPKWPRESIAEQEHFPQLDVALCYMFTPFPKD
jgi:hypothetical protein